MRNKLKRLLGAVLLEYSQPLIPPLPGDSMNLEPEETAWTGGGPSARFLSEQMHDAANQPAAATNPKNTLATGTVNSPLPGVLFIGPAEHGEALPKDARDTSLDLFQRPHNLAHVRHLS